MMGRGKEGREEYSGEERDTHTHHAIEECLGQPVRVKASLHCLSYSAQSGFLERCGEHEWVVGQQRQQLR